MEDGGRRVDRSEKRIGQLLRAIEWRTMAGEKAKKNDDRDGTIFGNTYI